MREISLHILDLVQNSIEAGARNISLTVIEDSLADRLIVRVTDDGRGMDDNTKLQVLNPFYTTRLTRRVGLGLPLIDMSTSHCDGKLNIASDVGMGTSVEANWRLSHLDRPPLGDLAATVKAIFAGNPDINIRYTHQIDSKSFTASSREIREILDGVPITQPDVLEWLTIYLTGHERQLYGGVPDENS